MTKRGITPGTFDPITYGHVDVIARASQIFDEVVVAVAASPGKGPMFSLDERVALAEEAVKDMPNVKVMPFTGLLVDFAQEVDAQFVVKGLRATTDFEYEFQMTAVNYELSPKLETVFIMSPPRYMYLSSSIVREVASLKGDVSKFVQPHVERALQEKFA